MSKNVLLSSQAKDDSLGHHKPARHHAIVQGFWHGDPLSPVHVACLRSFWRAGLGFNLYSYQNLWIPIGTTLCDAAEILGPDELFHFANPVTKLPDVAPFADYFRLQLLNVMGGWWCDIDTICLSGNLPVADRVWARQAPEYRPESVSNGQIYFTKGDWVLRRLLEEAAAELKHIARRETLGPELFSRILGELGLPLDMNANAASFYPIRYVENFKLWLPEFRDEVEARIEKATFLPLYQSFPLYLGFSAAKIPPRGSVIAGFVRQLAPDFDCPEHDAHEFRAAVRSWIAKNEKTVLPRLMAIQPDIEKWARA